MKNLGTHVALVLALCVLLVWWIYPPKERLRLGKDLRGGVSLTYSVKLPEGGNREAALAQVIDVLKQRVNPTGVLDISFAPQGTDRIEVVMPLPNPEVRQLQVRKQHRLCWRQQSRPDPLYLFPRSHTEDRLRVFFPLSLHQHTKGFRFYNSPVPWWLYRSRSLPALLLS